MEKWLPIKNYEGLYEVSNLGNIKSLYTNKILKPTIAKGYYQLNLYKNKERKTISIHRIVAEMFLDNHYNYPEVNHKNEIKTDNRVENLEWCTSKYNTNYRTAIKRRIINRTKKVYQYTLDNKLVKKYNSLHEVEKITSYDCRTICKCCLGKKKTYKGFKWSYELEV